MNKKLNFILLTIALNCFLALAASAQATAFTYQGRLTEASTPANGTFDFQFALYDAPTGGTHQGATQIISSVAVSNGSFTASLDFGAAAFPGAARYLEIQVKKPGDTSYTILAPRQSIASTPYAIRALQAANADTATNAVNADNASTAVSAQTATTADSATTAKTADALSSQCVLCVTDAQIASVSGSKVSGTVANATNATNATDAANATNTTNFSGSLSGDVTGTQTATVVSTIGGQTANSVASGAAAANAATSANTANTIVKRDASGNFTAGTVTANLSGNATSATTAGTAASASGVSSTAGNSVVTAINASNSSINTARVSGDVELAPSTQQTVSTTNSLINLKLIGARTLGQPGQDALLSLSASGNYSDGQTYDMERFRVDNTGSILSVASYDSGFSGAVPSEGAGTRFMWYGSKAALRAGQIDGTQWDDANIGLFSTAFGENVRALGDNSLAIGKSSVAAGSRTVAIGEGNTATGYASVALGYGASTSTSAGSPRSGTFVFSDFSVPISYNFGSSVDSSTQFHPTVTNSFNVRAVNGSFFYTNTALTTGFVFNSTTATMTLGNSKLSMKSDGSTTLTSNSGGTSGVTLPAGGGSWQSLSDRNSKENFQPVNPRDVLQRVLKLPISTWNYKTQAASIRHIGAMAQDFQAAFKVGEDDKHISTIDPDGVALAAIQGLNAEMNEADAKLKAENDHLRQQLRVQQKQLETQQTQFEARLKRLEQSMIVRRQTKRRR